MLGGGRLDSIRFKLLKEQSEKPVASCKVWVSEAWVNARAGLIHLPWHRCHPQIWRGSLLNTDPPCNIHAGRHAGIRLTFPERPEIPADVNSRAAAEPCAESLVSEFWPYLSICVCCIELTFSSHTFRCLDNNTIMIREGSELSVHVMLLFIFTMLNGSALMKAYLSIYQVRWNDQPVKASKQPNRAA
jgi:hypothetical protein